MVFLSKDERNNFLQAYRSCCESALLFILKALTPRLNNHSFSVTIKIGYLFRKF
jgi:hypothetical protein